MLFLSLYALHGGVYALNTANAGNKMNKIPFYIPTIEYFRKIIKTRKPMAKFAYSIKLNHFVTKMFGVSGIIHRIKLEFLG